MMLLGPRSVQAAGPDAVVSASTVRAKVLYGTSPDQQHRADIEPWITQAAAKAGSPLAQPYTDWLPLGNDEQELYSSMQGGRLIKGKATEKDGSFEVQINGFKIKPLKQTVLLRPGERRVVKLTDYPPPRNVFIALVAPLSGVAQARAGKLKAGVEDFHLKLDYNGQEDKPFYRLILSVPDIGYDRSNPFYRLVQIREAQAVKIIDDLGADGFLDKAVDLQSNVKLPPPTMPGYTLMVATKGLQLRQDLGWGLPMLNQLDGLREVLEGDAAKEMDLLLGRLSGLRKQWEKDTPPPDFSKLKEGITLSQAREFLGTTGRLRENPTPDEAIYDFDFDGRSVILIVDHRPKSAIVTRVTIWNHGNTVEQVRAARLKKWQEWIEARSPKMRMKTSMKGWELYIWQEGNATLYSLLPGTNRLKADDEIAQAAVKGFDAIKPKLAELKAGEMVFVHGERLAAPPPKDQADQVREYCRKAGLQVQ